MQLAYTKLDTIELKTLAQNKPIKIPLNNHLDSENIILNVQTSFQCLDLPPLILPYVL